MDLLLSPHLLCSLWLSSVSGQVLLYSLKVDCWLVYILEVHNPD